MPITDILAALMLGLAGSTHCLGMCGGVNSLLVTRDANGLQPLKANTVYIVLFNTGRILSYAVAGLALGSLSFAIQGLNPNIMALTRVVAGLLLVGMAFYVGRWWQGISYLESYAAKAWQFIQPMTKQFIPVNSAGSALKLGALWGWMPCGLVYSVLSWAVLAPDPVRAGVLMFSFGLGTLPAMIGAGLFSQALLGLLRKPLARNIAALLLLIFALWTIFTGVQLLMSETPHIHHH